MNATIKPGIPSATAIPVADVLAVLWLAENFVREELRTRRSSYLPTANEDELAQITEARITLCKIVHLKEWIAAVTHVSANAATIAEFEDEQREYGVGTGGKDYGPEREEEE